MSNASSFAMKDDMGDDRPEKGRTVLRCSWMASIRFSTWRFSATRLWPGHTASSNRGMAVGAWRPNCRLTCHRPGASLARPKSSRDSDLVRIVQDRVGPAGQAAAPQSGQLNASCYRVVKNPQIIGSISLTPPPCLTIFPASAKPNTRPGSIKGFRWCFA